MRKILNDQFLNIYQRLMAETYNVWLEKLNCLATIKILGVICPCPWAVCMYKIVKSLNIFFSETTWTVFFRIHMGPSVERMLTICLNGFALLNKMGVMPIYGKTLKNLLLQN